MLSLESVKKMYQSPGVIIDDPSKAHLRDGKSKYSERFKEEVRLYASLMGNKSMACRKYNLASSTVNQFFAQKKASENRG